jgi:drug/metabolite transporter (DMT)-like permease
MLYLSKEMRKIININNSRERSKTIVKINQRSKGIFLVIIGAMMWGISGTVAQYLFQKKGFSPEWLVVMRLLISGIILLTYGFIKNKKGIWEIWKSKEDCFNIICFSIIGMLGVQYTYFMTIKYGNAATATILQFLSPVIITCYVAIKTRKLPKLQEITAVILAMIGTFFIITKGNIHSISISKLTLFWGILTAFAAAFYTVQPRHLLIKFSSMIVVGWSMLIGGISFSFVHQPWDFVGEVSISSILAVIFVILFGTLISFYCYLESLKNIQPTEACLLSAVEPLSAAFLSVVWLHVPFGITEFIGTACIITTIIILSFVQVEGKCESVAIQ